MREKNIRSNRLRIGVTRKLVRGSKVKANWIGVAGSTDSLLGFTATPFLTDSSSQKLQAPIISHRQWLFSEHYFNLLCFVVFRFRTQVHPLGPHQMIQSPKVKPTEYRDLFQSSFSCHVASCLLLSSQMSLWLLFTCH